MGVAFLAGLTAKLTSHDFFFILLKDFKRQVSLA